MSSQKILNQNLSSVIQCHIKYAGQMVEFLFSDMTSERIRAVCRVRPKITTDREYPANTSSQNQYSS